MKTYKMFALMLTAVSCIAVADDAGKTPDLTLAMHNGDSINRLQPAALEEKTKLLAQARLNVAVDALNEKLSNQLEQKMARELIDSPVDSHSVVVVRFTR